ncbi:metalloregulator ArsR/SmtB family transcription factor [Luteitalea sp.]|uniref:ArsR/SmtB family transcription factor n=1 Tax=Luteitalea sp. TaxID=2004800 RepID=UPI0025BC467E|nr:metalloregulator ArsR/SmtB family transcription factor [Luteitalea sp.]
MSDRSTTPDAHCHPGDHPGPSGLTAAPAAIERAARLLRAIADDGRLRLLARLADGPHCVTALATAEGDSLSTVSQRLRVLRAEHLLVRRREGRHITYALADEHVLDIVRSALAHASEGI